MPTRYFRRLDTGELCQGTVGSDGPFTTPLARHRQNWADGHGIPVEQIEGIEVADATDVPDLTTARAPIPPPVPPPIVVPTTEAEVDRFAETASRHPATLEVAVASLLKRVAALEGARG